MLRTVLVFSYHDLTHFYTEEALLLSTASPSPIPFSMIVQPALARGTLLPLRRLLLDSLPWCLLVRRRRKVSLLLRHSGLLLVSRLLDSLLLVALII